ncbi:MAG: flagellar hook-basal body complex protein FliE [Candidatus Thermoplasmatota archaeon]|jgi:dephospho-CoA kinase|nr:flagellar hook-basal body complex protein FliE [Candidatus Thermoplasmatota archaeon]
MFLIVTGMPGAGKDEFIAVAKQSGYSDFHMGNAVRHFAETSNITVSDQDIGKFATSERNRHGMDIWARRTYESIKKTNRIIIDGMRNPEELEYFRSVEKIVYVVAVFANRRTRLERILRRHRQDDVSSMQELIMRDERELAWGIAKTIVLSDYLIVNDSSLADFRHRSAELIVRIENESGRK